MDGILPFSPQIQWQISYTNSKQFLFEMPGPFKVPKASQGTQLSLTSPQTLLRLLTEHSGRGMEPESTEEVNVEGISVSCLGEKVSITLGRFQDLILTVKAKESENKSLISGISLLFLPVYFGSIKHSSVFWYQQPGY